MRNFESRLSLHERGQSQYCSGSHCPSTADQDPDSRRWIVTPSFFEEAGDEARRDSMLAHQRIGCVVISSTRVVGIRTLGTADVGGIEVKCDATWDASGPFLPIGTTNQSGLSEECKGAALILRERTSTC